MNIVPCKLAPADPDTLTPADLPVLPTWYPLDPKDGPPLHETQRARERHARAQAQAVEGPYDGQVGQVVTTFGGMPPNVLLFADGAIAYVLDPRPDNGHAVYRYCPSRSAAHRGLMAAVAEVYGDHGKTYSDEARQGERRDTPGPEASPL